MKNAFIVAGIAFFVIFFSSSKIFAQTITTGDSTSQTTVNNQINTNVIECNCTPTPQETAAPSPTPVESTPVPTQSSGGGGGSSGGGGGSGSSSSQGSSTTTSSTQAQGQVLGASVLAATGSVSNIWAAFEELVGGLFIALGIYVSKYKEQK